MTYSVTTKCLSAAGIVAGIALPSVGTFYVLRIQYPNDPLIRVLSVTSWCLIVVAAGLLVFGLLHGGIRSLSKRRKRKEAWTTNGALLLKYVDYYAEIAKRESLAWAKLEREEQDYRTENPDGPIRLEQDVERRYRQSEMLNAERRLSDAKRDFIEIAPRRAKKAAKAEWSKK